MKNQENVRVRDDMFNWLKQDKSIYAWVPATMWMSVILLFSVLPFPDGLALVVSPFDKLIHFAEYAILALLIMGALYRSETATFEKNALFTLILAGGYGIVMELLQHFVPGRAMELYDMVADIVGVATGIILGKLVLWRK